MFQLIKPVIVCINLLGTVPTEHLSSVNFHRFCWALPSFAKYYQMNLLLLIST